MKNIKFFLILFNVALTLCWCQKSIAQDNDSLSINPVERTGNLLRPRLEIGAGVLSFNGDFGNRNSNYHQAIPNFAFHLKLDNEINSFLNLQFYTLFGKVSSNLNSPERHLNFESKIRTGGLALSYNFSHFLPQQRNITPYLSVGIETMEFNPKGDLYDVQGREYNYWSDGSIRDLPQNSAEAENAVIISRDYVYETDLREQGFDNTNKYALRTLSIPVGVGAEMKLDKNFNLRLGTELHLTFSDNIDNISAAGTGERKGNSANDRFIYTSFGLSYNLHDPKTDYLTDAFSEADLSGDLSDADGDGVIDLIDKCPLSPPGIEVDKFGCELDADADGVPDYMDEEPNSPAGSYVDEKGIALTDEDFHQRYLAYIDTVGNLHYDKSSTSTRDVHSVFMRDRKKVYSVKLGTADELSSDHIAQLLSIGDIKTKEIDGVTVYHAGEFKTLEEAVMRKIQLEDEGIPGDVIYEEYGQYIDVSDLAALAEWDLKGSYDYYEEIYNLNPDKVLFRVQIGAYRHRLSKNIFTKVDDLLIIEGNDGLTRYVSGSFGSMQEAARHKINLLLLGFEGAFVTAYQNGKRITLKQAGATVNVKEDISSDGYGRGNINSELINYSVQLGVFAGRIPADILNDYMNIGNVKPVRGENGVTKYISGSYDDKNSAEKALNKLKAEGYEDAFVVGEFNGQIIDVKEADRLKNL